jgi:predicted membrane-bound spermidine synthase
MALLKQFKTPFGTIRISRDRDGTLAYYQNGCFHSQATPRGVSVCAYVHVVHEIIRQKKAQKVLIIGCGGGTLATMLRRLRVHVTVVDINPVAFKIAQDYFSMPDDVVCVPKNGITYVRATTERFDAVVIDVFDADNKVPKGFTTKAFLGAVMKKLKRGGVLIMNVITKNTKDKCADIIASNMESAGMPVTLFEWSRERDSNTIIVGGSVIHVTLPSGHEPRLIRQELKGIIKRKPMK